MRASSLLDFALGQKIEMLVFKNADARSHAKGVASRYPFSYGRYRYTHSSRTYDCALIRRCHQSSLSEGRQRSAVRTDGFRYERRGYCPCCERPAVFSSEHPWFRDHLLCSLCGSLVRERALTLMLSEIMPDWRDAAIHESSPSASYMYAKMKREAPGYVASHFFPDEAFGN